jgi:hypothetical protein
MTLLAATGFDVLFGAGAYPYLFRPFPGSGASPSNLVTNDGRHPSWPINGCIGVNGGFVPFAIDPVDKHATLIESFAARLSTTGASSALCEGWGWSDSTGRATYVQHWTLVWDPSTLALKLYRGDGGGTLLASAAPPIALLNNWAHYALKVTLDDLGSYDLRYDDGSGYTTLFSGSADTRNGGSEALHAGLQSFFSLTGATLMDDLIIMNGAGSSFNDFIGDRQVMEVYPTADVTDQWIGSDGNSVNNYQLVDEHSAAIDLSDYVEGRANGDTDLYSCVDLPVALTPQDSIDAVCTYVTAQRVDSGARHMGVLTATAAGTIQGPDRLPPISVNNPDWRTLLHTNLTKPGGGAWTEAAVNDLRIGQIVTA